jgi:hypothetical protein
MRMRRDSRAANAYGSAMSDKDDTLRQNLTADWFGDGEDRARLEEAAARVTALRRALVPGRPLAPEEAESGVRADRHAALLAEIQRRKPIAT